MRSHGDPANPPWSKKRLVEIVHKNWPELLARFRSAVPTGEVPTEEEHQASRNAGVNTPVVMSDGTVYIGIGGFISSAGLSGAVVSQTHRLLGMVRDLARKIEEYHESLLQLVCRNTGKKLSS